MYVLYDAAFLHFQLSHGKEVTLNLFKGMVTPFTVHPDLDKGSGDIL